MKVLVKMEVYTFEEIEKAVKKFSELEKEHSEDCVLELEIKVINLI